MSDAALIELLLVVLLVGGGMYFRSYLAEKAKNLASKEDTAAITRLVEATKLDYSRQLEMFRSEAQYQWGSHSQYERDRREALLEFFETCTSLLADKLAVNLGDLPMDQGESLYKHQESIGQLFSRIYLDYLRLALYFPAESDLMKQAEMLRMVCTTA